MDLEDIHPEYVKGGEETIDQANTTGKTESASLKTDDQSWDHLQILNALLGYPHVHEFCKEPFKQEMQTPGMVLIGISHVALDIKLALISIILVGLPHLPGLNLGLQILLELIYLEINFIAFFRHTHYKSWVIFLVAVLRSLMYLICIGYLFISYLSLEQVDRMFSSSVQKTFTNLLLIGRIAEYLFLVLTLMVTIIDLVQDYKKKKQLELEKLESEKVEKEKNVKEEENQLRESDNGEDAENPA